MEDQLSTTFAALADPTRRAILAKLSLGETSVTELARPFEMSMPAITKHLKVLEKAGLIVERVYKVKEGRPNVVDLIKGEGIQLISNTPRGQDTFVDEKAIRRAAVLARIPTITTLAAARAAAEGISALQQGKLNVVSLQELHASRN